MAQGLSDRGWSAARTIALATLALLALAAWAGATRAEAAVGLDPAFGSGGLATTSDSTPSGGGGGVQLGIEPDGSVLVASVYGGREVRFDADGSQDLGFGGEGGVSFGALTAGFTNETLTFTARDAAFDSQGRTLIFGELTDRSHSIEEGYSGTVYGSSAVVIRLDAEGRLDPSFGDGKGYVVSTFGVRTRLPGADFPTVGIMAGTVDPLGRPVLIAGVQDGISPCYGKGSIGLAPAAVVRLTESGVPDPTFGGGDGDVPISGSGSVSQPVLGLDGEGGLVASVGRPGSYPAECGVGRDVYRLRGDGTRMGSFGHDGFRRFTRLELDFVEPSGALILSRRHGSTLDIVRVLPNGDRDKAFGHGGVAELHLGGATSHEFAPVAVDAQGRILLAGYGSTAPRAPVYLHGNEIVLGRLLADGEPDPSFGPKGLLRTRTPFRLTALRAALDPQGRLLVGATTSGTGEGTAGFLLARYLLE